MVNIYEAMKWVLQGVSSSLTVSSLNTPAVIGTQLSKATSSSPKVSKASKASTPAIDSLIIKTESLNALLAEFSKTITDMINKASKTSSNCAAS